MHTSVSKMRDREREVERARERETEREKIKSNTIDKQAEIDTLGIRCKRKKLLLRVGEKIGEMEREREREGGDGENGKRCEEALYGGQKRNV